MESSSMVASITPSTLPLVHSDSVDAASIMPVVATPPDPASIPVEAPNGSPKPPIGELMPDVAAAEAVSSPNKTTTPPPLTPSPPATTAIPMEAETPNHVLNGLGSPQAEPPTPSIEHHATTLFPGPNDTENVLSHDMDGHHTTEDPIFGDEEMYKAEPDFDIVMNEGSHLGHDSTTSPIGNGDYIQDPSHIPYGTSAEHDDHLDGPPLKRQKLDSPAPGGLGSDEIGNGIPMDSPVAPTAPWARPMTQPQNKFALSIVRTLKKHKDAVPFLQPVDPVALNIPHYPTIVTNPMDLSTVEKKLGGGLKTDSAQYQRYANVEEFVTDFKLIGANCLAFNGPEHLVTQMAQRLDEAFEKQMKNMPAAEDVQPPAVKPGPKKGVPVRRPSMAGGTHPRREDSYISARPKREVPPPRDHREFHEPPRRPAPVKKRFPKRDDGTVEQLKFCTKLVNELYRPKYSTFAYPFYEPVDWVKLEIPHYPKVVKKPMDMATMLQKLNNNQYPDSKAFHADFKLMIRNCFNFNPEGTPVHQAGVELNDVFDEKWQSLPPLYGETEDEGLEEEDSDDDRSNAVMLMEAQIQSLHNALASLKKKPKKEKIRKPLPPVPKPPKIPNGKPAGAPGAFKKKKKSGHEEEETLTFEQKKQLSETIQTLDGNRLERVLEIIDEVYPEIRETSEEIELDIDSLPPHVLIRLYNFVIRPNKPRVGRPPNGSASSKPTGAIAGTKRKSMNEEEESEKIRQLEATLARLKNGTATIEDLQAVEQPVNGGDDSGSDSDSSDSSGSDSE
ncbi:hypothetical protein FS842_000951 [Serendipita sp. 407]|nr:hypothetical protein FRC18_001793 [Serendipita sp. 400]KAG9055869.1 hypothetical protein FS842_000951 [Serendipita sp. 407]